MKKILSINLSNIVFNIDEDAYQLLERYLYNLKQYFRKKDDSAEIVDGLESRISELFTERVNSGFRVITIEHVEQVIAQMGKPEEMAEENDSDSSNKNEPEIEIPIKKKLYRNIDNKIFGGVLSGAAAYLDINTTLIRNLFVILTICGLGILIPLYIIFWVIIPPAETAAEKLSMHGKKITIDCIENSDSPRNFGETLIRSFGIIVKVALVILFGILSPVIFALFIVMIALIVAAISIAVGGGAFLFNAFPYADFSVLQGSPAWTITWGISVLILITLPIASIFYTILRQLFRLRSTPTSLKWVLVVLWFVCLVICGVAISQIDWSYHPMHSLMII